MRPGVRRLLLSQIVLALAAALLMFSVRAPTGFPGLAALYGGGMALVNSLLLAWRTGRAGRRASDGDGQLQVIMLMAGAVERLVFTLVAFALGMAVFDLDPVALIVGFACAELGYVGAAYRSLRP